jgi:dTDP-4-dehydrorhamnose reductase
MTTGTEIDGTGGVGCKQVLVAGAAGFVGAHLWPGLAARHRLVVASRKPMTGLPSGVVSSSGDLEKERFADELAGRDAEVVVYLAGLTDAERCEREPERATRANAEAPERLARAVSRSCRRFIYVSTDLVFDGGRGFYSESDAPGPISVYGRTKLEGERAVRSVLGDRALVVRLSLVYGARNHPESRESFAERMVRAAANGIPADLFVDELRTPIYVEDVTEFLLRLVELELAPALVHLGGPERLTRFDMGKIALEVFGLPSELARARLAAEAASLAPRPRDASLDTRLAKRLGLAAADVRTGLERMKRDMERKGFMVGS